MLKIYDNQENVCICPCLQATSSNSPECILWMAFSLTKAIARCKNLTDFSRCKDYFAISSFILFVISLTRKLFFIAKLAKRRMTNKL